MAGIRPQARGSAFTGIHIAFVVAIVLCVISWIGLGILYTSQTKLEQDREAALKDRDALASTGELSRFKGQFAKPNQTILGRLAEERGGMAKAISGQPDLDLATVNATIAGKYATIQDAKAIDNADVFSAELPLLGAVQTLYDSLVKERDRRISADTHLKETQDKLSQLTEGYDKAMRAFDQTVADVRDQLKVTQNQLADYTKANEQVLESLKTNASRAEEQLRKQTERHREELVAQEKDLTNLSNRLTDALSTLRQMRGQPDVLAVARQADGKIIRALPGDPFVYINLGAKDHLTLGMTFSIYGASEGIPATGEGKATMEITTIYDDVAAGKIISRSGDLPVLQGDLIANAIYDRSRKHRIVVVGRFDLDNSGLATGEGTDRVRAMVAEWGGEVVDALDTTTDFLVVGQGPAQPVPPGAAASPIDKQRHQERVAEYDAFQNTIREARSLMVPILNQTQFLHFVGYNLDALREGTLRNAARAAAE